MTFLRPRDYGTPPLRHTSRFTLLWNPSDYAGQSWVRIQATQLDDEQARTASQKRRVLDGWIELLIEGDPQISHLILDSRVPQRLLDAVRGVHGLQYLSVKWGPYDDLSPLSTSCGLEALHLGGAAGITTIAPLEPLSGLVELYLANAFKFTDYSELSRLTQLRYLSVGSEMGTDRRPHIPDMSWVRPLRELRLLALPGAIIDDGDLAPAAELPELVHLDA